MITKNKDKQKIILKKIKNIYENVLKNRIKYNEKYQLFFLFLI